jgi:hypothetical protein
VKAGSPALSPEQIRSIRVDMDDDIIFCPIGLYKFFLAKGKEGLEAKKLFDHLFFTARLQNNMYKKYYKVRANNSYLRKGLKWSDRKVQAMKKILVDAGIIRYARSVPSKENPAFGRVTILLRIPRRVKDGEPTRSPMHKEATVQNSYPVDTPTVQNPTPVENNTNSDGDQINININNLNLENNKKKKEEKKDEVKTPPSSSSESDDNRKRFRKVLPDAFFEIKGRLLKNCVIRSYSLSELESNKLDEFLECYRPEDDSFSDTFKKVVSTFFSRDFWFNFDRINNTHNYNFNNFLSHFQEIVDNMPPEQAAGSFDSTSEKLLHEIEEKAYDLLLKEISVEEVSGVKQHKDFAQFGELYLRAVLIDRHRPRFVELVNFVKSAL